MKEPLLSVIVPVYKVEPWLERCVDSIRIQTYQNLEIILVDDGSPDQCGVICDRLASEDRRILVIHRENGGLSAARNTGLDACHGEYIGFVDSDDVIHPEMYTRLYAHLCSFGTLLAFCQTRVFYDENIFFPPLEEKVSCFSRDEILVKSLSSQIWFSAVTKLYHKSLFEGLRYPEGRTNEDFPVTIQVFDRCDRIAVDFNQLYAYCKRDGSITMTPSYRNAFDQIISAEQVCLFLNVSHRELEHLTARILLSACIGFLLRTDSSAREHITEREYAFTTIRKYYKKEYRPPLLSIYQIILLYSANSRRWQYTTASWIYRTIHRLLAS